MKMIEEHELFSAKPWHVSDSVNALINEALQKEPKEQRNYIGASLLGDPCARRIAYTFSGTEPDTPATGEQLRTFEMGHHLEPLIASWLQKAGFQLKTQDKNGKQFGFGQASQGSPKTDVFGDGVNGKIQGHIDGVITRGPLKVKYPLLWECKTMKAAIWRELTKNKLEVINERYYAQVQLYMAYMKFKDCLFTSLNKDTAELYHELIPFDGKAASYYSDRAVRIVQSIENQEEESRLTRNSDYFECKMCRFYRACWKNDEKKLP